MAGMNGEQGRGKKEGEEEKMTEQRQGTERK